MDSRIPTSWLSGNLHAGRSFVQLSQAGITFVELMIAIAIIAVLTAIAVPSYKIYRDRALVFQAQTDIVGLAASLALYRQDNYVFPDSLADIGMDAKLDPWQHPYVYVNLSAPGGAGHARKDKNLHPLNSDYDLCSMGKDGRTAGPLTAAASRDDILRANDGRFVGLASDY